MLAGSKPLETKGDPRQSLEEHGVAAGVEVSHQAMQSGPNWSTDGQKSQRQGTCDGKEEL